MKTTTKLTCDCTFNTNGTCLFCESPKTCEVKINSQIIKTVIGGLKQ